MGPCRVCGRRIASYRSLSNHLRYSKDDAHLQLKEDWGQWKTTHYSRFKRCYKCGGSWEVRDKSLRHQKNCPSCRERKTLLGKRSYEKMPTTPYAGQPQAPQQYATSRLTPQVSPLLEKGLTVRTILSETGLSYESFRAQAEAELGVEDYDALMASRKAKCGAENLKVSHERYAALSPSEKAALMKARFGGTCELERGFAEQLESLGLPLTLNQWQTLNVQGELRPREADIKVDLGGRKVAIFCDGEAFHGPKVIHGDPAQRVGDDIATTRAYFDLGYSALRYSESEIHSGWAFAHFEQVLGKLKSFSKGYRTWHPEEELYE